MPTNREDNLALLRRAGEALAGAESYDELDQLVGEFRRGLWKRPKHALFAPVKIEFERQRNTIGSRPEPAPAVQRVPRDTGGRPVKAGTLIPAALAEIEAAPGPEDRQ